MRGALRLAVLLVSLWALVACQTVLVPLDQQQRLSDGDREAGEGQLIRVAVCWPAEPLMTSLVDAYAATALRASFDLLPTSSAEARSLVLSGQVDLAVVARADDDTLSLDSDASLTARRLAVDPLVIVAHPELPLGSISREQLQALYGGYYLDWSELSQGEGRPEFLMREAGSVPHNVWQDIIMDQAEVSTAALVVPYDGGIASYVGSHPQAIGYVSLGHVDDTVRVLALDGIQPLPDNVRSGNYPLRIALVMLLSPTASSEAGRLMSFCLGSGGRQVLGERYGVDW